MILIADSGSTKSDWRLINSLGDNLKDFSTMGFNPYFHSSDLVEAKLNRAVIYPSNVLHSGDIQTDLGLSNDPKKGRLTISSFIQLA